MIDAAGAWGQKIRSLAGSSPIKLTPLRRTIITFDAPAGLEVSKWPLVADQTHQFYFSPESGGLLASPMDEDPVEPGDVRPDELVVAQPWNASDNSPENPAKGLKTEMGRFKDLLL